MTATTLAVQLKKGLLIKGERKTELVLRTPTLDDLLAAEDMAHIATPVAFRVALVSVVLVRAGDFEGPFSPDMLKGLSSLDWKRLSDGLGKVEELGEVEPGDAPGN